MWANAEHLKIEASSASASASSLTLEHLLKQDELSNEGMSLYASIFVFWKGAHGYVLVAINKNI